MNRRKKGKFLFALTKRQDCKCFYCKQEIISFKEICDKKHHVILKEHNYVTIFDVTLKLTRKILIASLDHYIPRSKGGFDNEANLVASCKPCNERKDSC